MICPECKQEVSGTKSGVIKGKYISDRCNWCYEMETHGYNISMAAKFDREKDIQDNKKDLIQPYHSGKANPEFVKAYPSEAKKYFNNDELREAERR